MNASQAQTVQARAFWVKAPDHGVLREEALTLPQPPGEVLVRTRYSGISRGTEALVFGGRVIPQLNVQHLVGQLIES